ncbi:MAG: AzlD domain-containing protein [Acidimicrobiales bacterium]
MLVGAACCYLLKLAGLSVPRRVLDHPRTQQIAALLPIALLAALALTQTVATGSHLVLGARSAALVVAVVAVIRRAPFLVVVLLATGTAALVRLIT